MNSLYRNPVLQPACFALNGAWFSGGIEWNIGATGHTTLSCAPLHAALVAAPDGGEMLRLWEWERLRDLPFQVDLWLPDDSEFLLVGVRIRNPHERTAPVYWWSNIAVEEDEHTRVLAPADEAWHFGYERGLRRVPVPEFRGADRTYPLRGEFPADYFYEVPDRHGSGSPRSTPTVQGLVQTSTDVLRGRKLFVWGSGRGGRRWQHWLTEPGTPGYAEIQAGLARTQLEHVRLDGGAEFSWLEAYGPLDGRPGDRARDGLGRGAAPRSARRLESVLPRADGRRRVPGLAAVRRRRTGRAAGDRIRLGRARSAAGRASSCPARPSNRTRSARSRPPGGSCSASGALPGPRRVAPPGPTLVAPHWRDMLETAPAEPLTEYHLGVAQWHAGDLAQAVRSWERGLPLAPSRWPLLRCLAVADQRGGQPEACRRPVRGGLRRPVRRSGGTTARPGRRRRPRSAGRRSPRCSRWTAPPRPAGSGTGWRPPSGGAARFRFIEARLLLAEGDKDAARALFDAGFEVADLREGAETLSEVWAALTDDPLPDAYEFRMRPQN